MRNQELRTKLGRNAIEDVKAYAPANVIDMWIKLIEETANRTN